MLKNPMEEIMADCAVKFTIPKNPGIEKIRHSFEELENYISGSSMPGKSYLLQYLIEYDKSNMFQTLLGKLADSEIRLIGEELLKNAVSKNRQDVLESLLSTGIDVNYALKIACAYGRIEMVKFLVDNGADIHTDDDYPVCVSCTTGCGIDIVKFLHENGADIHARDELPLRISCEMGDFAVIQYLVNNNANVNTKNGHALRLVLDHGHDDCIEFLINAGADVGMLTFDDLYCLISKRWYHTTKLLVKYGVKFDIFNKYEFNKKDKELVDMLHNQGVNPETIACMMMLC